MFTYWKLRIVAMTSKKHILHLLNHLYW